MDTMERFVGESEHPSMRRSLKYDYLLIMVMLMMTTMVVMMMLLIVTMIMMMMVLVLFCFLVPYY